MAYEVRVLKTWGTRSPEQMCPFSENIVKKMTGNPDFANPPVTMTELEIASKRTLVAYGNRKNGAQARSELETAADAQNIMLIKLADYVSLNAIGDVNKILSTGFEVTKGTRTKAIVPETPAAPTLSCNNGFLYLNTRKVAGAESYFWVIYLGNIQPLSVVNSQLVIKTLEDTIIVPAGTTRELVKGIAAGTKVTVQVLAQNPAGKSSFSTAASHYINC